MFLQKFNSRETKKNLIEVTSNVIGGNILKIRGTYVHPKLIVNVASWCSVEYALKVSDIVLQYHTKEAIEEKEKLLKKKDDKIDKLRNDIKLLLKKNDDLMEHRTRSYNITPVLANTRHLHRLVPTPLPSWPLPLLPLPLLHSSRSE